MSVHMYCVKLSQAAKNVFVFHFYTQPAQSKNTPNIHWAISILFIVHLLYSCNLLLFAFSACVLSTSYKMLSVLHDSFRNISFRCVLCIFIRFVLSTLHLNGWSLYSSKHLITCQFSHCPMLPSSALCPHHSSQDCYKTHL